MLIMRKEYWVLLVLFFGMTVFLPAAEELRNQPGELFEVCGTAIEGVSEFEFLSRTDFPWWRGYDRNDIYPEGTRAPLEWSEEKNIVWKTPLEGLGYGTPTIVGDRIFLGNSQVDSDDSTKITVSIISLDRKTGAMIKEKPLFTGRQPKPIHRDNCNASATIACDGKRVYFPFLLDDVVKLYCCDLDLNILWMNDLGDFKSIHGLSPSPVLYGSLVIYGFDTRQPTPGYLTAMDRETGKIVWRIKRRIDNGGFGNPAIIRLAGRDQLLINGPNITSSYDPHNGNWLWSIDGPSEVNPSCPAWDDTTVWLSSGFPEKHIIAVKATGEGDITHAILWDRRKNPVPSYVPSLVQKEGLLYVLSDQGTFACLDGLTGEPFWIEKFDERFYSSPCIVGDNIYLFGREGVAWIFKAGKTPEKISENKLDSGAWATPVFLDNGIYLRTTNALYFIR